MQTCANKTGCVFARLGKGLLQLRPAPQPQPHTPTPTTTTNHKPQTHNSQTTKDKRETPGRRAAHGPCGVVRLSPLPSPSRPPAPSPQPPVTPSGPQPPALSQWVCPFPSSRGQGPGARARGQGQGPGPGARAASARGSQHCQLPGARGPLASLLSG
jgi:hypothetical protein